LAINLIIELGDEGFLYGVGTLQHAINTCQGAAGGILTGPQSGDSGDWTGQFITTGHATVEEIPSLVSALGLLFIILLLIFTGLYFVFRRILPSPSRSTSAPWVSKSGQPITPELWPGESSKPIAQFITTYALGDNRYDISFSINSSGQFIGECGVGISKVVGDSKPKKVTALEVWIFDKNDPNTVTKVLLSEYCYGDAELRAELAKKGEAVLMLPDQDVELVTNTLRLRAHVVEMDYGNDAQYPRSFFNQVALKLAVWLV